MMPLASTGASQSRAMQRSNSRARRARKVFRKASKAKRLRTKTFSRLEGLPNELIENIYGYSENLNLPATSRHLHQLLNHESVRLHFSFYIFTHRFTTNDGGFNSKYTSRIYAANYLRDYEIVLLQTALINGPWFDAAFARRLEAMTPELRALAGKRMDRDKALRHNLEPSTRTFEAQAKVRRVWYGCRKKAGKPRNIFDEGPRNVHMPRSLLTGNWTDGKVELFHRLRAWYIDPVSGQDPEATTTLRQARQQAIGDDREEIAAVINEYLLPTVSEELLRQCNEDMKSCCGAPHPDDWDPDL